METGCHIHAFQRISFLVLNLISSLLPVPVSIPIISKTPDSEIVEDRDNVTLTCSVEHGTNIQFKWLKNNMLVGPSDRHTFSQDNGTLVINPVKKEDIGQYICEARNHISQSQSKQADLGVFCEYPSFFSDFKLIYHVIIPCVNHWIVIARRFLLQPE